MGRLTEQRIVHVDQGSAAFPDDLAVTAEQVARRIVNRAPTNRVEVDVQHNLRQVALLIDELRLVPALPKATGPS